MATDALVVVKRKGIVSAAADALASVNSDDHKYRKEEDSGNLNYYYDDSIYADSGYSDYGYGYHPPTYDTRDTYYQSQEQYESAQIPVYTAHQIADYTPHEVPDDSQHQVPDDSQHQVPADTQHQVPDGVQFYEPEHNP